MSDPNSAWRLIESGESTGEENMRADVEMARAVQNGTAGPSLRLYRWKPWAISLGHHQREEDIKTDRCRRDGIDVVRRPTGGRAILHAEELTYCVVMPAEGRSVAEVYGAISAALVCGLRTICPGVSFETVQPDFRTLYRGAEAAPCFGSSARYEVQIGGRKLVGSAQRRYIAPPYPEVVLQHGSVLVGPAHRRLVEYLAVSDESIRDRIAADLERKTIDLSTAAGRSIGFEELTEALVHGFETTWNITLRQEKAELV